MQNFTPILANGWEQLIVVIVFFILSALGQLLSAKQEKPAQPQKPRPPKPPKGGVPQRAAPQAAGPQPRQDELRGEVEEFLRQMRGEPAAKPAPPRPVTVKVERVRPTPVVVAEAESVPRRESVQEHVSRHISTAEIAQQVAKLGDDVEQSDERMVAHLQETFQHRLGNLEHIAARPEARRSIMAEEVARMLASPQGMRQAILASEILRRPQL